MKVKNGADIRYKKEMLEFEVDDWLRARGWEHKCDFPGSLWLWVRKLDDGRTIATSRDSAVWITDSIQYVESDE